MLLGYVQKLLPFCFCEFWSWVGASSVVRLIGFPFICLCGFNFSWPIGAFFHQVIFPWKPWHLACIGYANLLVAFSCITHLHKIDTLTVRFLLTV